MITHPNCKINLALHITHRRPDGYHDLQSVFIPIPLCDELEINLSDHFSFQQNGIAIDCSVEDNVVVKSYRLMQRLYPTKTGNVAIRLNKHIPFGAGLGGGSSDAAFTIKMINHLFNLGLDSKTLRQIAAKIGADCPFFIDNTTALAQGIGDNLTQLGYNPIQDYTLFLVKPDVAISTAEAYGGIIPRDRLQSKTPIDITAVLRLPIEEWRYHLENDFEKNIFLKHPLLAHIKKEMYSSGALYASMSGSGSTIYGIFNSNMELDRLLALFSDHAKFVFQL